MTELSSSCTESSSLLVDSFKTARKLLKKPVDYNNLNEVHSRCKSIIEKLGTTLGALEDFDSSLKNTENVKESNSCREDKSNPLYRRKTKRKHLETEHYISDHHRTKKNPLKSVLSQSSVPKKKKRHTFKPFKNPLDLIEEFSAEHIKSEEVPAGEIVQTSVGRCETIASVLSPLTATNTWEHLQLRKMMEDPFLPAARKEYLPKRILELNENIIQDLLNRVETSDRSEFFLLDRLHKLSNDESLSADQKQQAECVLTALKDKIINDVMKNVGDSETNYDNTIDKLNSLLRIPWISLSDKKVFIEKVMEIRGRIANGISKQTHVPLDDGLQILEKFRLVMKDPFLSQESKVKLMQKVRYLRNTTIATLTKEALEENNTDLITKLNSMLQDPFLPYQKRLSIVQKIKDVEVKASKELKHTKIELKEKIMTSLNEILGFEGTNLEFIVGYGVQNPNYVRCIHIWNPEKA